MAKFKLPSPSLDFVGKQKPNLPSPNFISPKGMLMPANIQPPPMFGPRLTTIPPKYMENHHKLQNRMKFFCDLCEQEFKFHSQLEQHKTQHVQCGINGCSFIALSEIVDKHIEQQHNTGVYDKIKQLQTPEEIAKWTAERKKHYPTRAQVELKKKAQEARKKRGEILEESKNRFGHNRDRRHARNQTTAKCRNASRQYTNNRQNEPRQQEDGYARFLNKKPENLKVEKVLDQSKSETLKSNDVVHSSPNNSALASLMSMYGSDDDSDMDSEPDTKKFKEEPFKNIEEPKIGPDLKISNDKPILDIVTASCIKQSSGNIDNLKTTNKVDPLDTEDKDIDSDGNAPEETKFEKVKEIFCDNLQENTEKEIDQSKGITRKRVRTRRKGNKTDSQHFKTKSLIDYSKLQKRNQNTLLEKLLQPEIRHERNVILQCVRFVVENNFFGIGKK